MRRIFQLFILLLSTVPGVAQAHRAGDITGLYSFLHSGETVQINVQPDGRVSGYVSRVADGESDRGQMLDMMFEHASLDGNRLEFRTKKIHGVWFEFKGTVERGRVQTRDVEGYYVLRGTLTTVKEDVNGKPTPLATEVEFKSFPVGM
jgi:hypothetical protein